METSAVRIGIIGVGNCASSLIQGLAHYATSHEPRPVGLMHERIGGVGVGDVRVVSAFDVAAGEVGRDVAQAILAPPNNTLRFAEVGATGVEVLRAPTLDGLGALAREVVTESEAPPVDVVAALRASGTEVLVNYLPVGSERATRYFAECALAAGAAFVNCIPVFIASDGGWARRFAEARLPLVGDDIKSQVGATIVHRTLVELLATRGVTVDRTSQLNVGGNADFRNMLERDRLASKKRSKTEAVTSRLGAPLEADRVHVGPSDFVPWLEDRKWAHVRVEGRGFGGAPMAIELKLEVWDSPNSAGIVIDAVRCARLAMARGEGGALAAPSSAFMKAPPVQLSDWEAHRGLEAFIGNDSGVASSVPAPVPPLRQRAVGR